MKAIYVTIDGGMGSGKSRLMHKLAILLQGEGHAVECLDQGEEVKASELWASEFVEPRKIVLHAVLPTELQAKPPHLELLRLIDEAEFYGRGGGRKLWLNVEGLGFSWMGRSDDLQQLLTNEMQGVQCSVAKEVKQLLLGDRMDRMLSRLADGHGMRITSSRENGLRRWRICAPAVDCRTLEREGGCDAGSH